MILNPSQRIQRALGEAPQFAIPGRRQAGEIQWDKDHPSLRGCIALFTPGTQQGSGKIYDAITGIRLDRVNSAFTPNPAQDKRFGRVFECPSNGSGNDGWEDIGRISQKIHGLAALSIISIIRFSALDVSNNGAEKSAFRCALAANKGVSLSYLTKLQKLRFLLDTTGTTGWTAANDVSFAMSASTYYVMGFSFDGSTQRFYAGELGGKISQVGSATVTGTVAITSASSAPSVVQGMDYSSFSYTGGIEGVVADVRIFNRAITAGDVNEYSRNTYAAASFGGGGLRLVSTANPSISIVADALSATGTIDGASVVSVAKSAGVLSAQSSVSGTASVSNGVEIAADALSAISGIAGSPIISVSKSTNALTATASISGSHAISVLNAAEALSASTTIDGVQYVGVTITATPLSSAGALSGAVSVSGAVSIASDPLTAESSVSGAQITSVSKSADALIANASINGSQFVEISLTADPLSAVSAITGLPIVSINKSADPLSATSELSANYVDNIIVAAAELLASGSISGTVVIAGEVTEIIINPHAVSITPRYRTASISPHYRVQ